MNRVTLKLAPGLPTLLSRAVVVFGALLCSLAMAQTAKKPAPSSQAVGPYKDFKGVIKLDIRDSKADWGPFTPKKAPAGAPTFSSSSTTTPVSPPGRRSAAG